MPDLASCRECHVGARSVVGKVTSDCATCHKFHEGKDFWHGALQAQMQEVAARAEQQARQSFDKGTGKFKAEGSAGVQLYRDRKSVV